MSVEAYKKVQYNTGNKSEKVIESLQFYIRAGSKESLLNAHQLVSGLLIAIASSPQSPYVTYLYQTYKFIANEILEEIKQPGKGKMNKVNNILDELKNIVV